MILNYLNSKKRSNEKDLTFDSFFVFLMLRTGICTWFFFRFQVWVGNPVNYPKPVPWKPEKIRFRTWTRTWKTWKNQVPYLNPNLKNLKKSGSVPETCTWKTWKNQVRYLKPVPEKPEKIRFGTWTQTWKTWKNQVTYPKTENATWIFSP
jgi:hypothetical protein